jgi:hypothetical protein
VMFLYYPLVKESTYHNIILLDFFFNEEEGTIFVRFLT